jgi:hypothetical protein
MLTTRQAASCENAKTEPCKCKCQCHGQFHGAARGSVKRLPETDPHFPRLQVTYQGKPLGFRIVDRVTGEIHDSKKTYRTKTELRSAALEAVKWLTERISASPKLR